MATKALQSINFGQPVYEADGKTVVAMKSNFGESNYAFKANVFKMDTYSVVGHKEGEKLFLIAPVVATANGSEAFDLEFKEKKGEKWEIDKAKSGEAWGKWMNDGFQTVLLTEGIDSFEVLASVSAELGMVLIDKNPSSAKFHSFKFENKAEIAEKLLSVCVKWVEGYAVNPQKPWTVEGCESILDDSDWLAKVGMFYVPLINPTEHEVLRYTYGKALDPQTGYRLPPLKSDATAPHEGISITMPEIKARGGSGSWGSKSETTEEKIAYREKYLLAAMGESSLVDLITKATNPKEKELQAKLDIILRIMG